MRRPGREIPQRREWKFFKHKDNIEFKITLGWTLLNILYTGQAVRFVLCCVIFLYRLNKRNHTPPGIIKTWAVLGNT